ncbi:thiamine phosphate synthase [Chitinophaga sp.]|uniref:thiamine phosphate synthase n=1 Tax=Chitinophaga sp. TaxID=1869181 RepID=UPI0031DFC84B
MFNRRLYLVISEAACKGRDLVAVAKAAVKGGVDVIQLREKELDNAAFLDRALRLREALLPHGVPLIINDNLWVAQQCSATGIHVGNSDLAPLAIRAQWPACGILGYSVEYEKQIWHADAAASDYLALSPIFATPTKRDTVTEWKLEGIRHIRALTDKPLVAIGAIHEGNAADVISAGADCLAIVSAICGAPDPEKAAAAIRLQIEKAL